MMYSYKKNLKGMLNNMLLTKDVEFLLFKGLCSR